MDRQRKFNLMGAVLIAAIALMSRGKLQSLDAHAGAANEVWKVNAVAQR
jgi:hypothetical protein